MLEPSAIEDGDTVGQFEGLFLVVRHEQRGVAGAIVQFAQPAAKVAAYLRIERAERLVEQEHARLDSQGAGQRHTLALAARQLRRIALAQPGKLHQLQQILGPLADFRARRP